jgi:hypothetical protein
MADKEYDMARIKTGDYDWLKERAKKNHRTILGEFAAIRELLEYLGIDSLPRPEDGSFVPVIHQHEIKGR